jgi:hypothetical protein
VRDTQNGRGRRSLRVILAASMLLAWFPAWHAALGLGRSQPAPRPTTSPFLALGAMDGRQLVLDLRTGRHLVVPTATPVLGHLPMTAEARAELAGNAATATVPAAMAKKIRNPALPGATGSPSAPAADASTRRATGDPFDPELAGTRQSVFYGPTTITHGPGTVTTVLGGRCDGLPGPQTSVSPGNVVVDRAGRVFWVDVGSDLHAQSGVYIRTLDPDGRVRTLGNLNGPIEGRFFRGWGTVESTNVRIVPDQSGGVFYTFNRFVDDGHPSGPDWQARDVPAGAPAIGRLRADGSNQFVAGALGLPTGHNDGGPVENAAFGDIAAMATDGHGNLYVADASLLTVADASGSAFAQGEAEGPAGQRFGVDQPGYVAATRIRFLNFSAHDVTFYPGTNNAVTVAAHTVGTIAGAPEGAVFTDTTDGTTPSPEPGDGPVAAASAHIPFVAGMVVGPHGVTLLASSEVYLAVGSGLTSTSVVERRDVYLLGLNTAGETQPMSGTAVAPGMTAVLGGGPLGYAGDGGPLAGARFDVRDHDGWFYGDLTPDGHGGLLVADTYNNAIRDISAAGTVRTVAGGTAPRSAADRLNYPMGVAVGPHGLVVSDWGTSRIVEVEPTGHTHLLAGNGQAAFCGIGSIATGDISRPADLAGGVLARDRAYLTGADVGDAVDAVTDSHGVTYAAIPDYGVVVRIDPTGTVSIAAGRPRSCRVAPPLYFGLSLGCQPPLAGSGDGGRPQDAILEDPENLLLDQYDNLYISDGDAVRYVNFGGRTYRPQGVAVPAGTIATVYRHPVKRLHLPLFPTIGNCQDFCNTYLDVIVGLGAMTLDPHRGTLFVVDQLNQQVLAVNYCGKDYLVAGRATTLATQITNLLGAKPPASPLGDGKPAYDVDIAPSALAYDSRRDLLLMTDDLSAPGSTAGAGRVLAVNVGSQAVDLWGFSLAPRDIATYAGGAGCSLDQFCSYGDGSHARAVAFEFPFGIAIDGGGNVYVAEATNRIRRIGSDGVVGTIAGISRDMYDPFGVGSASGSWWFNGGECADGGAAANACFTGLHSLHLDPAGDLVVTDVVSGRVRRIIHATAAPLRPNAAPIRGAGWGFTPAVRLPNFGQESTDSSLTVDSEGNVYDMAATSGATPALGGAGDGIRIGPTLQKTPCAVWSYAIDADGHGHDAPVYLGEPDAASATAQGLRTCSLAASPTGSTALTPPPGSGDRLVFGSGAVRGQLGASNVTAGASRDGAHTFLSSPNAALTTTSMTDIDDPSVVAIDGDTSGMSFQDSSDGVVDFALSRGGTQYVQLTRVADIGVHDFEAPTRITSRPAITGSDGLVPVFATSINGCQRLVAGAFSCIGGDIGTSTTTIETVATANRGLTWNTPSVVKTLPCRTNFLWVRDAYCFGYHGAPQLAVDASGTGYLVWDDGRHIVLSHSTDHGMTWSTPTPVDAGVPDAAYPAIVAGAGGRVAIAFYGSTVDGRDIGTPNHQWWVYLATSTDAGSSRPTFTQSVVSSSAVHEGALCQTDGTLCGIFVPPGPADAGDGIQVAMDPQTGRAIVAYSESRGIHDDGSSAGIVVTRQCTGPSLLMHAIARPCSVSSASTATGPVRCAPQGSDPVGDAQWSGAEQSALDLRRLGLQIAGGSLTAAVDVASFGATPPAGATGTGWTVTWSARGVNYFLRARSPSVGDPTAVSNDPSAPTLSYQWGTVGGGNSEAVAGSATGHVSGNTVVMSVPAVDVGDPQPGTRLSDLAARTEVLTGGVADGPTGTWTSVDTLTTRNGYDAGLHCAAIGTSPSPLPVARAAAAHRAAAHPTPLPTVDPLPTLPVTPPPILVPAPPLIPSCGVLPPAVPVPTPTPLPARHRPHLHALVVPPVAPPVRWDSGQVPDRAIAVAQVPPQAQAEAPQPVTQPLSQLVGAGAPQDENAPAAGFATERGWSPSDDAAWMLAAATLTMAMGAGLVLHRRRRGQLAAEKLGA